MLAAASIAAIGAPASADRSGLVIATASVPGEPYATAVTRDGNAVFVSVSAAHAGDRTGIAVFRHTATRLTPIGFVPLRSPRPLGLALSSDESTLLVADGDGLAMVDARAARRGAVTSAHYVRTRSAPGMTDVVASPDGRFAYAAEARRDVVGIFALRRRTDGTVDAVASGEIAVDRLPEALALSPRGDMLYVASRLSRVNHDVSARPACASGSLAVLDVGKADRGRGTAFAGTTAGCEPGQMALSADGKTVWLALRGERRAVGIDASRIRSGGHAVIASVPAGPAPVALALVGHDTAIVVADSRQFDPSAAGSSATFYDVRDKPAVINGFLTGSDPVRFTASPDGSTLYLTNRRSRSVQMIDAFHAVQPGE